MRLVGTSESRSEITGRLKNVVLDKDGENQLDRPVKNEEILHRVKEGRNILHKIKERRLYGLVRSCARTTF
jgi:hypothetical protein